MPNFHSQTGELAKLENAAYVILPVPYEFTTSYIKGTEFGPQAIIEASDQLEYYDDELGCEPKDAGIHTASPLQIVRGGPERQNKIIYQRWRELLSADKRVGMLGGEHSISFGAVQACLERYPDLTVLHLDAHCDLRDEYLGDRYGHANVMRRIRDLTGNTLSLGVRALCTEERDYIEQSGAKVYTTFQLRKDHGLIQKIIDNLSGKIYLTFDVDVLDPSLMPAVGTPEPGGWGWYETLSFLRAVIGKCDLVGFDVVELCPIGGHHASAFTIAKLVYKIIGYDCCRKRGH